MGKKTPKGSFIPGSGKKPKGEPPSEPKRFRWSFAHLDYGGPFCFSVSDGPTISQVLRKLGHFEGMSWTELTAAKCHTVQVTALSKDAQDRLVQLRMDDVDELYSLRFMNVQRAYAVRHDMVMGIIWWDPDHNRVYPTQKRNT